MTDTADANTPDASTLPPEVYDAPPDPDAYPGPAGTPGPPSAPNS